MTARERLGSEACPEPWRRGAPAELEVLAALLRDVRFRPGWSFELITYGSETVLAVELQTVDTYDRPRPGHVARPVLIGHKFVVPPRLCADRAWWRRWLLERIGDVDRHEACEWFMDGEVRPFDPHHDPMQPAYAVSDWTAAP